jgi:hypothetical protein
MTPQPRAFMGEWACLFGLDAFEEKKEARSHAVGGLSEFADRISLVMSGSLLMEFTPLRATPAQNQNDPGHQQVKPQPHYCCGLDGFAGICHTQRVVNKNYRGACGRLERWRVICPANTVRIRWVINNRQRTALPKVRGPILGLGLVREKGRVNLRLPSGSVYEIGNTETKNIVVAKGQGALCISSVPARGASVWCGLDFATQHSGICLPPGRWGRPAVACDDASAPEKEECAQDDQRLAERPPVDGVSLIFRGPRRVRYLGRTKQSRNSGLIMRAS